MVVRKAEQESRAECNVAEGETTDTGGTAAGCADSHCARKLPAGCLLPGCSVLSSGEGKRTKALMAGERRGLAFGSMALAYKFLGRGADPTY